MFNSNYCFRLFYINTLIFLFLLLSSSSSSSSLLLEKIKKKIKKKWHFLFPSFLSWFLIDDVGRGRAAQGISISIILYYEIPFDNFGMFYDQSY